MESKKVSSELTIAHEIESSPGIFYLGRNAFDITSTPFERLLWSEYIKQVVIIASANDILLKIGASS